MKIALIGYGKMGKEIEKVAVARGHEIVSIIDVDNQDDFNSEAFKSADVAIEFTNPMVAYDNYMKTFAAGVKLVSGSTGWMDKHGDEVKELCTKGGKTLFWSSNFSLGVAIFSAVNKYLAKIMNNFPAYEVSMTETHHIHKLDAPSGTAITLAEGILENMNRKSKWVKGTMVAPDGTVHAVDVAEAGIGARVAIFYSPEIAVGRLAAACHCGDYAVGGELTYAVVARVGEIVVVDVGTTLVDILLVGNPAALMGVCQAGFAAHSLLVTVATQSTGSHVGSGEGLGIPVIIRAIDRVHVVAGDIHVVARGVHGQP